MANAQYNTEQIKIYYETRESNKLDVINLFKEDYGIILTEAIVGHQRQQLGNWIYMLKDVMTTEEAFKDYCIEVPKQTRIPWKKNPKWSKWIKNNAHLSIRELMYRFYTKWTDEKGNHVKVSTNAMTIQRQRLGKNKSISTSNQYTVREKDIHPAIYIEPDYVVKNCVEQIPVICYAYQHKTFKNGAGPLYDSGCSMCAAAGQMSLTELKDHPFGQNPAKLYCVQFEDETVKTGHCSMKGIKYRGRKWPPFKILRDNDIILFEARRIEAATQNTGFRMPLYEPLKGDGGTECFEGIHLNKILKLIDEEIKCLK